MATLAPYSAKRTAIACPMPELPPVTRTFLPFSPGMASTVGWALASVSDMKAPLSKCPLVRATAEALHPPPHPSERKRGGARRGEVDPEVAEVAEDQSGPLAACGVEARAGRGRTEPDQRDEERQDHQRAPAREHRVEQRNGHARLEGDRGGDRDRRVRHGPADRMHHRPWEQGLGEPGARGGASELGGDVARGIAWRHPPERPAGGVLAHGYIAMSGAGSASGCLPGAPLRSSTKPVSGKSRTESRPAPISAALSAAEMRCSSCPIAVAATMKGSEVACMSPAIAVRRPSSTRR